MCGRFEQSETREYYARAIGLDIGGPGWVGSDTIPQYNLSPGTAPLILHTLKGKLKSDRVRWGCRTPKDVEEKRRPWINARIEKALTGRYFRHMFREGRQVKYLNNGSVAKNKKQLCFSFLTKCFFNNF